jgi:leader peptidase (prepilin peptidase)/N-methyltransferase
VNAAAAAAVAAGATLFYWAVAATAAARRRLAVGALPPALTVTVAVVAAAAAIGGVRPSAIGACAAAAVAGLVDARTGSIFDPLTGALFVASLALAAFAGSLGDAVAGTAATGGLLALLYAVTRGRGIGFGDVKLGAALGAALGASAGLRAIAFAFILGGGYGAWLLASGRATRGASIRFGPFIAAGTFTALLLPRVW